MRRASVIASSSCALLLTACDLGPFDMDPRFQALGRQMDDAAIVVASERSVDVFDSSAPMNGGAALGPRRAAISARLVSSSGRRPDLATVSADPNSTPPFPMKSSSAAGQTFVAEGAVRLLPGFRVRQGTYRILGLDALGRIARGTSNVAGDASNRVVASWGARLGLLSDSAARSGLSISFQGATVPGAAYDYVEASPRAPATALRLGMQVSAVSTTAFRLQASTSRGQWGLTGGLGSTNGSFRVQRRALLTYADSTTGAESERAGVWERATANVGVTRQLARVELALQYGFASRPSNGSGTALGINAAARHSLALGAQMRF